MLPVERQTSIIELLDADGFVKASDLRRAFEVSHMTIQRDLQALEHRGLLLRVRGGATTVQARDLGYGLRERINLAEKEAIGARAATLVGDGDTVFIDAGTTCMEVARHLLKRHLPHLVLVTTSVKVSTLTAGARGLSVTQLGGEIYGQSYGVVGPAAAAALDGLRVDLAFLGTSGVDLEAGFTNNNHAELPIKQAALRSARRGIFLADSSKMGRATLAQIAPTHPPHTLVTSGRLPQGGNAELQKLGWEVIQVDGR